MTIPEINPCKNGGAFWFSTLDSKVLWDTCNRSDWFLWVLENGKYKDTKKLIKFACECIRRTPCGNKKAWNVIEAQAIKNIVIYTEQYYEGQCSKEDLTAGALVAWASPHSKYHFELFIPFIAELNTDPMLIAKYVSWEMALSSGDIRKGLAYQADLIREIIGFDDMERCALYIREKQIQPPSIDVLKGE